MPISLDAFFLITFEPIGIPIGPDTHKIELIIYRYTQRSKESKPYNQLPSDNELSYLYQGIH